MYPGYDENFFFPKILLFRKIVLFFYMQATFNKAPPLQSHDCILPDNIYELTQEDGGYRSVG